MLLSMTGFGEAGARRNGVGVTVEVRTVNSRFFKLSLRTTEGYSTLEPRVDSRVRKQVRRGAVQVNVRVQREHSADDYRIDAEVLGSYRRQLDALQASWGGAESVPLGSLLTLPGVVEESCESAHDPNEEWPVVEEALSAALESLERMRRDEGKAMAEDLRANCRQAAASLEEIARRGPAMVSQYREKLQQRLRTALAEMEVVADTPEIIREVALYADRCDISEEIVRLRAHLEHFESHMDASESNGRKLEFLTQEMLRETNTIGSKANDVEVAQHVIEIKSAIERIREMIQNVE